MAVRANANVAAFASAHRRAPCFGNAIKGGRLGAWRERWQLQPLVRPPTLRMPGSDCAMPSAGARRGAARMPISVHS